MNFTESETFSLGRLRDTLIRLEDTIIFGEQVFRFAFQSMTSAWANAIAMLEHVESEGTNFKPQWSHFPQPIESA